MGHAQDSEERPLSEDGAENTLRTRTEDRFQHRYRTVGRSGLFSEGGGPAI